MEDIKNLHPMDVIKMMKEMEDYQSDFEMVAHFMKDDEAFIKLKSAISEEE
jgi:hypothetical protein